MYNYKSSRFFMLLMLAIVVSGVACKDDYNLPYQPLEKYIKVYMPQAVNGAVVRTLKITDSAQTLVYGANYGGQGYPDADIEVSFAVNNSKVDSFNNANRTNYPLLPASAYTLSATSAIIPKGKVATEPLTITFKTNGAGAMDALKTYVLPITLSTKTLAVNEALRTAFYVVKAQPDLKDYPNYDRAVWQVIDFSSQEANGEGANNGRAIFALDNNINTFWHTQWQGASPGPPHHITIDMGSEKVLHGLSFQGRQNDGGGKPNEVNVQVSTDNVTWSDAGSFTLQNNKNVQPVFMPNGFKPARYFKVIINSAYNGGYTIVSELNAF
ncbi:DUF1735 domain-containing protein [Paraflavitalea sp. CAU 1676]|uniref:BT_3987 domain-containing protein n=1 Tax=Paraflavitalea sp. CAU 1676 TaxID=3032598 RepID=UPI0023DA7E62|nr:DUF1735 domain-containing protein [Paraflavitalea sp. CAU 1676]MDF2191468.1 DUF1735 domain-containing protein [Paraflavitalea sp. CAU 1676]